MSTLFLLAVQRGPWPAIGGWDPNGRRQSGLMRAGRKRECPIRAQGHHGHRGANPVMIYRPSRGDTAFTVPLV